MEIAWKLWKLGFLWTARLENAFPRSLNIFSIGVSHTLALSLKSLKKVSKKVINKSI